ncbi:Putrescine oxidase [Mycobacteroides salmoniphilum]|nr:Putrescine oxidase [Mycobacteroides salmoniphilum]
MTSSNGVIERHFILDEITAVLWSPTSRTVGAAPILAGHSGGMTLGRRDGADVDRFGPKAASPQGYHEQDWTNERYSVGGMISHAPTGVLTEFGPALRQPCGRIHWAGTESSATMLGWVDGAIRAGERAAAEVMSEEG